MKKINLQVVIIAIVGAILINYLKPNQWNILIYFLLFFIFIFSVMQNLYYIFKTRKGIYANGFLVEIEADKGGNDEKKIVIEFLCPTDNKKYQIPFTANNSGKLSKEEIKVWINRNNPDKSLPVRTFDTPVIVSIISGTVFSILFLILLIYSWY